MSRKFPVYVYPPVYKIYRNIIGFSERYWIGLTRRETCFTGCPRDFFFSPSQCGENPIITNHDHRASTESCCECRKHWVWLDQSEYDFQNWDYFGAPASNSVCAFIARGSAGRWQSSDCKIYNNRYICKRQVLAQSTPQPERIYLPRKIQTIYKRRVI